MLQAFIITAMSKWAKSSETKVDDYFVEGIAEALNITVTQNKPIPDGNIFLGDAQIEDLKVARAKATGVPHPVKKSESPSGIRNTDE